MTLAQAGSPITADMVNREYTSADSNNTTVTGSSLVALSSSYTIAASDAAAGTAYRLSAWGYGTWGSTGQVLTLAMVLAGTAIGNEPQVSASVFSASAAFRWEAAAVLKCTSTGSTGTWSGLLKATLTQTANPVLPGTAADGTVHLCATTGSTDATQDTTVANSWVIKASWASTTGSPTITCTDTMLERLAT